MRHKRTKDHDGDKIISKSVLESSFVMKSISSPDTHATSLEKSIT